MANEVTIMPTRVLGGAFHAIAKEMAGVLFRMSYSSIIRESEDFGAALVDDEGVMHPVVGEALADESRGAW